MSKYRALRTYLEGRSTDAVPMTFAEIERLLGFKLPRSQAYPAWWSNNPTNNVMTNEWLAAGYKTEQVDIAGRKLVFRRIPGPQAAKPAPGFEEASIMPEFKPLSAAPPPEPVGGKTRRRHPGFGALKDVTWIAPGVDLTEPAYPEWADIVDDPNWQP